MSEMESLSKINSILDFVRLSDTSIQSYNHTFLNQKPSFHLISFSTLSISVLKSQNLFKILKSKNLWMSIPMSSKVLLFFIQDIIVKLITMTSCDSKSNFKKKKFQRIASKDEYKWKKLIEILKFFEK